MTGMGQPRDGVDKAIPARRTSLMAPGTTTPIPPYLATASLRIALTAFALGTLAGIALPRAIQIVSLDVWKSGDSASSSNIGGLWQQAQGQTTSSEVLAIWQRPQLHFYLLAWSLFHLLEFVITARWNNTRLYSDCKWGEGRGRQYLMVADTLSFPYICSLPHSEWNCIPPGPSFRHC